MGIGWQSPTISAPTLTSNFVLSATLAVALEHLVSPGEGKWPLG